MAQQPEFRGTTRRQALALGAGLGLAAARIPEAGAASGSAAAVPTRPIPRTGERLPVIGLGTDEYYGGGGAQRAAMRDVVRMLVDGGGKVIDTSSDYGQSEKLIAAVLRETGLQPRVFLATKLESDALQSADMTASLHRLGVSRLDLIQVHNVASPGQSLAQLRAWQAQRLVRYIGITTSVSSAFGALEAVMRREKPDFVELNYSAGDREAEARILPAAAELGIATLIDVPFGGRGGNLLGGLRGKPLPGWAGEIGAASWGQLLLKFVLANPAVTCIIPGTRNAGHMAENLAAARGRLPDAGQCRELARLIDDLG